MSVIDVCLGLHPLPTGSTKKGEKGISDGVQMAEVATAEEKATPVIPAAAVMKRS